MTTNKLESILLVAIASIFTLVIVLVLILTFGSVNETSLVLVLIYQFLSWDYIIYNCYKQLKLNKKLQSEIPCKTARDAEFVNKNIEEGKKYHL